MRYIYTALFYLSLPYVFLRLLWRSRRVPANRTRWAERLGFGKPLADKCIWFHLASVGETISAAPLVKLIQKNYPQIPIVVTNMTVTGAARAESLFDENVIKALVPYDLPNAIARFLQRTRPLIAIFFETELWPNIIHACEQSFIPVLVVNARLSEKSAKGYQRVASITGPMLKAIRNITIQTEIEKTRFLNLGLPKEVANVTGNIKFDLEVPAELDAKKIILRNELGETRLIWVAASTHSGEEEIVLAAHKKILEKIPSALLILVPRHPDRFNTVFSLIQQQNFNVMRRTQNLPCTPATQVYLADTMGEMLLMYAVSDVAFIGGSYADVGGHNMLEAAVLSKPVLTGPILHNFKEISRNLVAAGGMRVIENPENLADEVIHLLRDNLYRQKIGESAANFVAANKGALTKQYNAIKSVLTERLL